MAKVCKILIVDDHPAVREGLGLHITLDPEMEVCGEAADITTALSLLETTEPDVAVIDVSLKSGNGIDLIKRIKAMHHTVRILVWSVYPDCVYAERALRAGALGYINKEHTTGRIMEAIQRVRDGEIYLSDETTRQLLQRTVGVKSPVEKNPVDSLSDRELEVFNLIGDGMATADIAQRLYISVNTVETHRQRIKTKLKLKTAAELTNTAIRWKLEEF